MRAVRWFRPGRPAVQETAGSSGRGFWSGTGKGRPGGKAGAGRTGSTSWSEGSPRVLSCGMRFGCASTTRLG
eukprot:4426318-Heterocapsa_arctica.AAC.1